MLFILKSAILLLVYVLAAKLGLEYGRLHQSVTLFWPPSGIALGVVLLGGPRYLPTVFLAAWWAAIDSPPVFAVGSALANVLETSFAYVLVTRWCHCNKALTQVQDVLSMVLLAGSLACAGGALAGAMALVAAGTVATQALPDVVWIWWRGDMLGVAFFAPLVLLFAKPRAYFSSRISVWETAALWLCASGVGWLVYLGGQAPWLTLNQPPQLAWLFPIIFWAGLRTGRRNTVLIQLMFLAQALASANLGVGYYADGFQSYGEVNFWLTVMALALLPLSLAILTRERWLATAQTDLHAKVFSLSNDAVEICDAQNRIISVNPAFTLITGYTPEQVLGRNPSVCASGQHDHLFYQAMWHTLNSTDAWQGEVWNRRQSGELYLASMFIRTVRDAQGQVVNRLGIFSDITETRAQAEAVKHQAQHDFLTNLPNRLLFTDRFSQLLAQARRNASMFAVIYLDLDGFKGINDTLGHPVGDQLLVAVAERLTALVREVDTVSRLGGDEFAVLVSDVSKSADVVTLADKMLNALAMPYPLPPHEVRVTASLGLAVYPHHGLDMESLVAAADEALLQAKEEGKNGWLLSEVDWQDDDAPERFRNSRD
ncbi:diguanylate cyclase [Rhodoferax sp.]|uniref:diguanylate cyclase domain-containing protein n=1 Tax=Rhodoferax sp. TaxID=50421 RepID=UPI00262C6EFA|nr:diguanylate cyclase [Rhodoferax sp.]MDD5480925.1 diguanylate cyclase [Rhodoferax sp.]